MPSVCYKCMAYTWGPMPSQHIRSRWALSFPPFPPLFFTLIHSHLMLSFQLSPSFFHGSCEEAEQHLLTQGWSGAWWYQGWGTRQAREQPSPANLLVKKLCGETNLSLLTSPVCRCQVLLHWFLSRLLSALGGGSSCVSLLGWGSQ